MRCSWCEPLLDQYLERDLPRRQMLRVAQHLRTCASCSGMMAELRVVDGLLATARDRDLPPNFSFAAMAEIRTLQRPHRRNGAVWFALALYLVCAWIAASVALAFANGGDVLGKGFLGRVYDELAHGGPWHALVATLHAFNLFTPLVAPAVAVILFVDVALMIGLFYFYRALRPRLAARLAEREIW